jgi:hypothetical protein
MSATSLFDASELTAFADKLLAKGVARRAAITMSSREARRTSRTTSAKTSPAPATSQSAASPSPTR